MLRMQLPIPLQAVKVVTGDLLPFSVSQVKSSGGQVKSSCILVGSLGALVSSSGTAAEA